MKRIVYWLTLIAFYSLCSCHNSVKDIQPKSDFESTTAPLPQFDLRINSGGSKVLRFDSIAQGGNFTINFTPMTFARLSPLLDGNGILLTLDTSNWKKDSTQYTITKNTVSRKGLIYIYNNLYKKDTVIIPEPVDTTCSELPDRTVPIRFFDLISEIHSLFPDTFQGKVDSISTNFYQASIINQGATIRYLPDPSTQLQKWGFDTLWFKLKARNRKCFTGKLLIVIGDTCEPQARPDILTATNGQFLIPETVLTENDKSCSNMLGVYLTRTQEDFDYGNYKVMNTSNGLLTDTLVNGNQYYKYLKTKPGATEDGFDYYFKNMTTGRTTKAKVTIKF